MTRRLTVVSVAFPLAAVGPDSVGGAEQVLASLDRALVEAGHRSIVVAPEGSIVAGELASIPTQPGVLDDAARARAHAAVRGRLMALAGDADVVHLHGIDFPAYLPPPGPPALVTLHLPTGWYSDLDRAARRPGTFLHCVSPRQHAACAPGIDLLAPIANGVDVERLGASAPRRRDGAVMLGRICPEKGQHIALRAARAAGIPLVVAGVAYPYPTHQAYFDDEVRPLLDASRRCVGAVGFAEKRRLLGGARCLLVPSLAPETSSLVAMEALACGTPVIAFRAGALVDIVADGVTGFLVDDAAGMAAAIGRAGEIDPSACRAAARARFDVRDMTRAYLALYARLARVPA